MSKFHEPFSPTIMETEVPKKFIHKPWELNNEKILKLGKDYPKPIVMHEEARQKALSSFKKI